jgi:ubiquinone/menaquinone biosynthesis C-methylase UbiE
MMKPEVDLSGTAFGEVDKTGNAASFISYLDQATNQFSVVKTFTHGLLGLRPSERVLDVGCGTGDDVRELAAMVAPHGFAAGVDKSEAMIVEARRRANGCGLPVQFEVSEAEQLPWQSDHFDACRADRLLQHLPDPNRVLTEMLRVLKPGGRLLVVDRDWGMTALDSVDSLTTQAVLDRACSGIRNGLMGRRLLGLFRSAGIAEIKVQTQTLAIASFEIADTMLDLRTIAGHAVKEGRITRHASDVWLDDLLERDRLGMFFSTITLYVAFGSKTTVV